MPLHCGKRLPTARRWRQAPPANMHGRLAALLPRLRVLKAFALTRSQ